MTGSSLTRLIAVDPGDAHVGVAFFELNGSSDPWAAEVAPEWECVDAQEWRPDDFVEAFAEALLDNDVQVLVYERFRLYGDLAREQIGSEFLTSQMIGVLRFLVRIHNTHAERHLHAAARGQLLDCEMPYGVHAVDGTAPNPVGIHGQMADIKKPTRAILKSRGVKSTASRLKAGGHAADAELHGWKYLLDRPKVTEGLPS